MTDVLRIVPINNFRDVKCFEVYDVHDNGSIKWIIIVIIHTKNLYHFFNVAQNNQAKQRHVIMTTATKSR